ncbi:MAG TPA: hypothetical protein VM847_20710 [Tahibacter sp.]|nr:hypothetical protein [Tahibacter sp.]
MIPTRLALAFAAGLAVSCTASAHSEIPDAAWCAGGRVAYSGEFAFTREELYAELYHRQQDALARCIQETGQPNTAGGVGTCGIFDPPYETAFMMARRVCGAPTNSAPSPDDGVVAFVLEPASFNADDHHESFNFDSGIHGICGICLPVTAPMPPRGQD